MSSMSDRSAATVDALWAQLETVLDPCSLAFAAPISVVSLGLVDDLKLSGSSATVRLLLTMPACTMFGDIASQVRAALLVVEGVDDVRVELESRVEWSEGRMSPEARDALVARRAAYRERYQVLPRGRQPA
jgi:metal-sulfur cluster biosynthetic enzyme